MLKIYGAGIAGLLAANMLRRHDPVVYEVQPSLPNNHAALLRFRSDAVSRATGIPFRKVRVNKCMLYGSGTYGNTNLRLSNMYSQKVTGRVLDRSILSLEPVDRYIAPYNFIEQLSKDVNIRYGVPADDIAESIPDGDTTISTIPMPALMGLMDWKNVPEFGHRAIRSITADVEHPYIDVYQTIYYPGPEPFYRASITGNHLIIEFVNDQHDVGGGTDIAVQYVMDHFGIDEYSLTNFKETVQEYGKLLPTDEQFRKQFILAMSDKYDIYSLGRFATWRQILLDDIVNDVNVIEQFMTQRDAYGSRLARQ